MNIKITYNWLLEYLDTDASPYDIQKYLSLCGPSVEKVDKMGDDYVFNIEITSNRVDAASVFGIAQECQAILPEFGKKAKLKFDPLNDYKFVNIQKKYCNKNSLKVIIKDRDLCSRFTALVFEDLNLKPSPELISKRLTLCGIRSINNVVDISNYLMLSLGQPVHVFDYDQVKKSMMIMRRSKKGEKIITLDEKEITLSGNDIVIEDGEGRLIDLCGIMGGANSAVSNKTKSIILFVQTYNKNLVRKTIMTTGQRTEAATLFEKGLDEERVEPTLVYGGELLEKFAAGKIASQIIDIYPNPYFKRKSISVSYEFFNKIIGVTIEPRKIKRIFTSLGFKINNLEDDRTKIVSVSIPSWRQYDIDIKEDLVEEVARIYGYNKLPNQLQPIVYLRQPPEIEKLFKIQSKIKYFLKYIGLNEFINYSMISKEMIEDSGLKTEKHLKLSNSISQEIEYMRMSLLPSLYKNIKDNSVKTRYNTAPGEKGVMRFFEIAKVYFKNSVLKDSPCREVYKLGIAVNTDYFDLKGIVEALYKELNINDGLGQMITNEIKIEEKNGVFLTEIDLQKLIDDYRQIPNYKPITPYAVIKLDKTFELEPKHTFQMIKKLAFQSNLLQKIEVVSIFRNKLSLRFYYSSSQKNITEEEAKRELEKI